MIHYHILYYGKTKCPDVSQWLSAVMNSCEAQ